MSLPEDGRILVIGAPGDLNGDALPLDRCTVLQRFAPDHDQWARRGVTTTLAAEGPFAAAVVFPARARDLSESRIAEACAAVPDGLVVVDGPKTDGIEPLLKAVRSRVPLAGQVSKAHGKCFWFASTPDFADWARAPSRNAQGMWTAPGVFSADAQDPGTDMLLAALPDKLGAQVADLGAGWGGLASGILRREAVGTLHLVEADRTALDCAERNLDDPRARFHWADALTWTAPERLDAVVMNPPFHVGRAPDPALGRAFITAARKMLKPSGNLWLVANRHLPYESQLESDFRHFEEIAGNSRFKILHGYRPKA